MFKNDKFDTKKLCVLAIFTAITVVLAMFATFRVGNAVKIPFKFISVFIIGTLYGPFAGGLVSALGDIINALVFPVAAWLPQLTAIEMLNGVCYGLFFYKRALKGKGYVARALLCTVALFVVDMVGTTFILTQVGFFSSFAASFAVRLPAGIIKALIQFTVILIGVKFMPILARETEKNRFKNYANSFQTVTRPGLERINALLEEMGNPQKSLKCIHIAGTNGKGSVAAFIQKMLMASGFKTGKYISPNLVRVNERITVNDREISTKELNKLLNELEAHSEAVEKKLGEIPTQFEVWTAAAFKYFAEKKCDYVVLETGLGGRLDATNAIEKNSLAIITKIDFDHTDYLGDTLEKIASEKAGIIKPGCPVVSAPQYPEVEAVLQKKARELGSSIVFAKQPTQENYNDIYETLQTDDISAKLGLGGINQLENAAVAVTAAKLLGLDRENIVKGLETAENPARFEKVGKKLIFDGGHNPSGFGTLNKNLEKYYANEKAVFIMASMKDKDITKNLEIIKERAQNIRFVKVKNNARSAEAEELAEKAKLLGMEARAFDSLEEALEGTEDKLTVICGSLYLYKDFCEIKNKMVKI